MICASLLDFLNTGGLGPIRPGATMEEVVALLGEPEEKLGKPLPQTREDRYWDYGNLEIEFARRRDAGAYVEFLQIARPERLRGNTAQLAPTLTLDLHGLSGQSRPSEFIRAISDSDRVEVCLVDIAQYPAVTVYVGEGLEINFDLGAEDPVETLPPLVEYVRAFDSEAAWTDLYAYDPRCRTSRRAREDTWPGRYAPFTVTGRDYLEALER